MADFDDGNDFVFDPIPPNECADEVTESDSKFDRITSVLGLSRLKRPEPLVDGFLYSGTLAQIAGGPGSCKTFLALGWSVALAAGETSWEGHRIPQQRNVLYVAAEGASGLGVRIRAICESSKIPLQRIEGKFMILPEAAQIGDKHDMAELILRIREDNVGLVVFDTRALCTIGFDENSATEQGTPISMALEAIRQTGTTILVVHHATRAGANQGGAGRGSNAWDGAVWTDMRLSKDEDKTVTVKCEKHKDAPSGCTHRFVAKEWTVEGEYAAGLEVSRPEDLQTLVVMQTLNPIRPEKEEEVLKVFDEYALSDGLTVKQIHEYGDIPLTTVRRTLKSMEERGRVVNIGTEARQRYKRP